MNIDEEQRARLKQQDIDHRERERAQRIRSNNPSLRMLKAAFSRGYQDGFADVKNDHPKWTMSGYRYGWEVGRQGRLMRRSSLFKFLDGAEGSSHCQRSKGWHEVSP